MTTITGINNSQTTGSTTSTNATTATTAAPTTSYANPVNNSPYSHLSSTVVKLSGDSGIVAALDGSSTPLYNAVGLLNSITQAGQNNTAQNTSTANGGTQGSATTPVTGSTSTSLNTNWANILSATPQAAGTLTADTADQAIIATL